MATIRVRDWTKEQIEEIRDAESHSSHDSVIKSLLKDRKLAKYADDAAETVPASTTESQTNGPDTPFDDLTVLGELSGADNGVLFLWCPSCGNELAHLTADNPLGLSVFEIECQRCLTHLDRHAIVAIEIGYPIEQKLVDDCLQDDLKDCVVDYWDRTLDSAAVGALADDLDPEYLAWQFDQYLREFSWAWPADVPVVGFASGETYRNTATDEYLEVIEPVSENRNAMDSFKIRRYATEPATGDGETEILDSTTVVDHIVNRRLLLDSRTDSTSVSESTEPTT
ncbi:hypothetical protein [Haloarcula sp. 1CSR25-25]|uniref:hypothetical protein n=1 Tax=Haloarcula sp. 1CSR25-25 TaxID=2862545 RepID=UPI00289409EF|nr:hypothetical protein [Haloarcula sp. 1CSR25-25]MDT3435810.1 hypothetical protein [Haloarcula sp. 1CSR25-25]